MELAKRLKEEALLRTTVTLVFTGTWVGFGYLALADSGQISVTLDGAFRGVIDLLTQQATVWEDDLGQDLRIVEIPSQLCEQVKEMRLLMIERISETDDVLMLKYLEKITFL